MTYVTVHQTLKLQFGPATDHTCECGSPAVDWAYQRGAPDEQLDPVMNRIYSEDLSMYQPMCRSCHLKLDADLRHISTWDESSREAHRKAVQKGGLVHAERMKTDSAYRDKHLKQLATGRGFKRKRRCGECPMETHAAALGHHQKASGHTGYTDI